MNSFKEEHKRIELQYLESPDKDQRIPREQKKIAD